MRARCGSICLFSILFAWFALTAFPSPARGQAPEPVPEALLPADCPVYLRFDGVETHRNGFNSTALGELLAGELAPLTADLMGRVMDAVGPDAIASVLLSGGAPEDLVALQQETQQLPQFLDLLRRKGLVLAAEIPDVPAPAGQLILVFPGAAQEPDRRAVESALRLAGRLQKVHLKETTHAGRKVLEGTLFGVAHLACWQEGPHMLLTVGTIPAAQTIARIEQGGPSLAERPLWKKVAGFRGYETYARGFAAVGPLRKLLEAFVPEAALVLKELGLDGLESVRFELGFAGRYQRATLAFDVPGPRRGLFKMLAEGEPFVPAKLPPLPPQTSTLWASRIDLAETYRYAIDTLEKILAASRPDEREGFRGDLARFEAAIGGNPAELLLPTLGPTAVLYSAPGEGFAFFGGALAIEIKDRQKLEAALERVVQALAQASGDSYTLLRREYRGTEFFLFEAQGQFNFFSPSLAVSDGWLYIGLAPQAVKGAIYRSQGKAARLTLAPALTRCLADNQGASAEPAKLVGLTQFDPRPSVQTVMALVPLLGLVQRASGGEGGGFFKNFDITLIPPPQALTEPLLPGFSFLHDDGEAFTYDIHATLPLPLDFSAFGSLFGFAGLGLGF